MVKVNFSLKKGTTFGIHDFTINREDYDFTGTVITFKVLNKRLKKEIFKITPELELSNGSCYFELLKNAEETQELEKGNYDCEMLIEYPNNIVRCLFEGDFNIYD